MSQAAIAINYHSSSDGAESAVAEISSAGRNAFAMQGDMTHAEDVAALIRETVSALKSHIDILVHVTGGLVARKTLAEMDIDHWNRVMDLNATSIFRAAQAVLPHMAPGAIIGLARPDGTEADPGQRRMLLQRER